MVEKVKPLFVVLHAAFAPERRAGLDRVLGVLDSEMTLLWEDREAKGSLNPWLQALAAAVTRAQLTAATHVTVLPDDAILPPGFVQSLKAAIAVKPNDVLCFQANHNGAAQAYADGASWYTTTEGFTAFAGTFPIALLREYLAWYDRSMLMPGTDARDGGRGANGDESVNLWAMSTGRLIHKGLPSLVDHDLDVPSLDGHEDQDKVLRRPVAMATGPATYDGPTVYLGRTYTGNHWDMVYKLRPSAWNIERMYEAYRDGPVSTEPHIMIVTPVYGEPGAILARTDPSRERVIADLTDHGVSCSMLKTPGDSLVQRMRQRVQHAFLKSSATHLLWWDADIECLDPQCVRAMLATGHDIVAGAYPFKDETGRVVCNLWPKVVESGELAITRGCLEVQDAATGFMLVTRRVHTELMKAHPELLHASRGTEDWLEPLFATYDTSIVGGVYLSEDYQFCRLWQDHGGKVHVYVPAKFRHWGYHGFQGSLEEQYGLERAG